MNRTIQNFRNRVVGTMCRAMMLAGLVLTTLSGWGQSFPEGINYQLVLRDNTGALVVSQTVEVQIGIISSSITGPVEYEETHTVTSSVNGYIGLVIGQGTPTGSGAVNNIDQIDWSADNMYINVQTDIGQTGTFTDISTTQFFAVPYAMHSKTSDQTYTLNELVDVNTTGLVPGYTLVWNGTEWVATTISTVNVDTVSYATTSTFANTADTAQFAWNAQNITPSDTAMFAWDADSSAYATTAGVALTALQADYADTAQYALNCLDGWSLNGNALAGGEVIGSSNAQDVVFVTDNTERMRLTSNGELGIGTSSPQTGLDIAGDNGVLFTGTFGAGTSQTFSGNRMVWYPKKAHFYAGGGTVSLNDAFMGNYSFATGYNNSSAGDYSFVMGNACQANGEASFAGGSSSVANGDYSIAFGQNSATDGEAAVGLGRGAFGHGTGAVALGYHPHALEDYAVAIGFYTRATDTSSFALGHRARSFHKGTFVYSDYSDPNLHFDSDGENKFMVRAAGGTVFYSSTDLTAGVQLAAGGGAWMSVSDSTKKENFQAVDGEKVLQQLKGVDVTSWNYIAQDDSIRHIGPMAQDFYATFGYGESDTTITTTDIDGVNLAALQALMVRYEALEEEVSAYEGWQAERAQLLEERDALEERILRMETLMQEMLQAKDGAAGTGSSTTLTSRNP